MVFQLQGILKFSPLKILRDSIDTFDGFDLFYIKKYPIQSVKGKLLPRFLTC